MAIANLDAKVRSEMGSPNSRRARLEGLIPAVVYGHKLDPVHLHISEDALETAFKGHTHLCRINIGDQMEQVVVKDVQYDYLGDTLMHVDFLRVDMNEKIEVQVAVEVEGNAKGLGEGGVLEQSQNDITVRCTPDKIPDVILLNVESLGLHDAIRNKDVLLEDGVEIVGDPEASVVMVVERFIKQASEEEEGEGEEGTPETPTTD